MSGYLDFKETGILVVDRILSLLEMAGNSYHSTEMWSEDDYGDGSYVDQIQAAANTVAAALEEKDKDIADLVYKLRWMKQRIPEGVLPELVVTMDMLIAKYGENNSERFELVRESEAL